MTGTAAQAFSTQLRELTQAEHSEAESSEFIATLMEGKRSARDYALLLSQYGYIYAALEEEAAALRARPELADLLDPRLDRVASIRADLAGLLPAAGLAAQPALPATEAYVAAIRAAAADPARLVAHHYLRYLGDLSGGQVIARLVARHYAVDPEHLSMWRFEGIGKHKPYKDAYRGKLDAYAVDGARRTALAEEARAGYRFNQSLFRELLEQSRSLGEPPRRA